MLTADHVRFRRVGDRMELLPLRAPAVERLRTASAEWVEILRLGIGEAREDLVAALNGVEVTPGDRRPASAFIKLLLDRCSFEVESAHDPVAARKAVFERASRAREVDGAAFDRGAVIEAAAGDLGLPPPEVEAALYADLRRAHRLKSFDAITPDALLDLYPLAQAQAALLRATRVTVRIDASDAGACRHVFRTLKFRRLLYTLTREADAYRIEIDGPLAMFQATTRYGMELALTLPALRCCPRWSLDAELRWGKERRPLTLSLSGERADAAGEPAQPEELERLVERVRATETPWRVTRARALLDLPGVGLCVPDLVFTHPERKRSIYLELLGFWSREAVWRRIDLVQAGLGEPVVFALSSRLRVSEAALEPDAEAALYVYKGAMSPRAVLERVEALSAVVG